MNLNAIHISTTPPKIAKMIAADKEAFDANAIPKHKGNAARNKRQMHKFYNC